MTSLLAYHDWMTTRGLPFWATAGFDSANGRFRERLDWSGNPIDIPHRSMVQARQIYVFAGAQELGWSDNGAALAERAMSSLLRDFCTESPHEASFAFSIDTRGQAVSSVRDAYAHAFLLFAFASLYRVNANERLIELARKTNAFVKQQLVDERHGGLFDMHPVTSRDKRQNPLMHLLEAYLALERAAPGRGFLDDAGRLVALFEKRLFDRHSGVLLEYFEENWSTHREASKAHVFEPGHHFEWVWLLREYEQLSGRPVGEYTTQLYDVAQTDGVASDGMLYDEVSTDRTVLKNSHRVWPHTEAIKAAAAQHANGDTNARTFAESMAGVLLNNFLEQPFSGGWIDHLNASGRPLLDYVPASSLYHLFFAASESAQHFTLSQRVTPTA